MPRGGKPGKRIPEGTPTPGQMLNAIPAHAKRFLLDWFLESYGDDWRSKIYESPEHLEEMVELIKHHKRLIDNRMIE